jgi:hypothetical protein
MFQTIRRHFKRHEPWYLMIAAIWGFFMSIFAICTMDIYLRADSMRQLGYEAKVINLDCYAKYKGRWFRCTSVIDNQVQVTN